MAAVPRSDDIVDISFCDEGQKRKGYKQPHAVKKPSVGGVQEKGDDGRFQNESGGNFGNRDRAMRAAANNTGPRSGLNQAIQASDLGIEGRSEGPVVTSRNHENGGVAIELRTLGTTSMAAPRRKDSEKSDGDSLFE